METIVVNNHDLVDVQPAAVIASGGKSMFAAEFCVELTSPSHDESIPRTEVWNHRDESVVVGEPQFTNQRTMR